MDADQKQFLQEHTIEEITSTITKAVIYIDTETSLEETCKILGKNNISAVPILDVHKNTFVGMVDVVDIAYFIAYTYEQQKDIQDAGFHYFKDIRAYDLLAISSEGTLMYTFSPKMSLDNVLEPFSKGIHRALITTEGDSKYHILSQMDVLKFLYQSGKFESWFAAPLVNIPALFEFKPALETLLADAPAIQGFKKLGRNKLGAVAVLDHDGTLIGNLSATDLRGIAVDSLIKLIFRPVNQFLQLVRGKDDAAPIVVKMDDSLGSVVEKLIKNDVHRVWIVDGQGKLDSLVSCSDICRVFTDIY